jgi:hypothetical protein
VFDLAFEREVIDPLSHQRLPRTREVFRAPAAHGVFSIESKYVCFIWIYWLAGARCQVTEFDHRSIPTVQHSDKPAYY